MAITSCWEGLLSGSCCGERVILVIIHPAGRDKNSRSEWTHMTGIRAYRAFPSFDYSHLDGLGYYIFSFDLPAPVRTS